MRRLKSVALLQLLPPLDGSGLHAEHLLPAVLGLKVLDAGRLVDPGVPDHDLVEVVADDAEARSAGLGDDDGVSGAVDGGVDGVGLGGKGDGAGLGLFLWAGELGNVG